MCLLWNFVRRQSFAIFILMIFCLLIILNNLPFKEIKKVGELEEISNNEKIVLRGLVENEIYNDKGKRLVLDNGLEVICYGQCPLYINEQVEIFAKFEKYEDRYYIEALEIKVLD